MTKQECNFPVEDYNGETRMASVDRLIFHTGTIVDLVLFQGDVDYLNNMGIVVEVKNEGI